tara:strand:- start:101 stop:268 length:168 start_codon:yes stop_codon:yes gene_type:complete
MAIKAQLTVPTKMHKDMCLLADEQEIGVATLYRNCMLDWYEKNYQQLSTFWRVKN